MSKVHILNEDVISKIAAGEIIERPASVIKELVENSLDAGATAIELHLKDAGKTLIHIKDDGHGIAQDDLEKIFFRHATSKIRETADLYKINSLGFRGEALYSIGAVSDVALQSKTKDQDGGWEITLQGGKRLGLKPCAMNSHGTDIKIKELFFNTPARKKFLKTDSAEIHQVLNTFIPYTLIHPAVRFRLSHQGKDLINLPPTSDFIDRSAFALNLEKQFILEARKNYPENNCSIRLVLGDMNIKRSRRDMQFYFINGRPVFNKNIAYHLNQIYRLLIPPDSFAFFAVYIDIPAEDIDVNIHPTKREVKIKNEGDVCAKIRRLCEETLMKTAGKLISEQSAYEHSGVQRSFSSPYRGTPAIDRVSPAESSDFPVRDYSFPVSPTSLFAQAQNNLQDKLRKAKYIGPFINKYQLFESEGALLLIDQHAAQERITYEMLIKQLDKGTPDIQHLLSPVVINLTAQEMIVWEELKEEMEKVGLASSSFDNESIAIHSHPRLLKDIEKAVRDILAEGALPSYDHDVMARRACRSSIMTGDKLSKEQAEFQRDQLVACLDPFTCPHGRPTVIELSEIFLDKQFLRTK